MRIEPLSPALGARVEGLDLRLPLTVATRSELLHAWHQHHLLLFREQDLTPQQQVAFAACFGPVQPELDTGDTSVLISNHRQPAVLREGAFSYHMDFSFTPVPVEAICLYAMAMPPGGSQTRFASNVAPLARVPAAELDALRAMRVRNSADFSDIRHDIVRYREGPAPPGSPVQDWPLIRRHPRQAYEVFSCCEQQTEAVVGLDALQSNNLIEQLYRELLYHPDNIHEHHWQPGDLLIWDNISLQHGRPDVRPDDGERTLRRVTVARHNAVRHLLQQLGTASTSDIRA